MFRQTTFRIPRSEWPRFKLFLSAELDALESVVAFINASKPRSDVEVLAAECWETTHTPKDLSDAVISIGINISSLQRSVEKSIGEILAGVSTSLKDDGFPGWAEQDSDQYSAAWSDRSDLLEALLSQDNAVEIMSKARELLYDFQSLLLDSAVLTDVRYVFDRNAAEMKGALVLHTLSLDYIEGREHRQAHLVLSNADIARLLRQLQRAQRKAKVTMESLDVPELTPTEST